jgi:hypothetical protein
VQSPPARYPWRGATLGVACVAPAIALAVMPPIVRTSTFHRYADVRGLWGLPNAGDVLSNLPLMIVGVLGLLAVRRVAGLPRGLVALAFAGVLGIGVGSAVYHAHPVDTTLAFDWGPIVVAMSWMISLIVADRISVRAGWACAVILPILSVASVAWWYAGGGFAGGGDLRFYVGMQLALVAAVPLIVFLYPRGRIDRWWLLAAVGTFLVARVIARNDVSLLDTIGVSGHSLKHVLVGLATWFVLVAVTVSRPASLRSSGRPLRRTPSPAPSSSPARLAPAPPPRPAPPAHDLP